MSGEGIVIIGSLLLILRGPAGLLTLLTCEEICAYFLFGILQHNPVVFKLCAAALWGAVRNLKGAANFFREDEILQFFYRNLLGCAAKKFWSLSGCREPKSLKTTDIIL
jgi:hypothetical protein